MANNGLVRVGIFSLEEVFSNIPTYVPGETFRSRVKFGNFTVKMTSQRYRLFKNKGTKCVVCGLEGTFFSLDEQTLEDGKHYHFNLMAVNAAGEDVLMTKDHIVPRSKGGKDHMSNYQVMCQKCNSLKGNTIPDNIPS